MSLHTSETTPKTAGKRFNWIAFFCLGAYYGGYGRVVFGTWINFVAYATFWLPMMLYCGFRANKDLKLAERNFHWGKAIGTLAASMVFISIALFVANKELREEAFGDPRVLLGEVSGVWHTENLDQQGTPMNFLIDLVTEDKRFEIRSATGVETILSCEAHVRDVSRFTGEVVADLIKYGETVESITLEKVENYDGEKGHIRMTFESSNETCDLYLMMGL